MARYYPVSPRFWTDETVRGWDDQERLLALYLLTCPHRNLEGLYRLPLSYVAADLGWTLHRVKVAIDRLCEDRFVSYDAEVDVVFVRRALHYQAPKSERQIKGAIAALAEVPHTPLREAFEEVAETVSPEFAKALGNAYANGSR